MNNAGDVYPPEIKIKRFLDTAAYFLLYHNMDGIETPYRRVIHAKTEIPASNCTSMVDNILYASGVTSDDVAKEEQAAFRALTDKLDEDADVLYKNKKQVKKQKSLFSKKLKKGIHGGEWVRVDTDGKFWVGKQQYVISDQAIQYQPVPTEYGDYYAMDKILVSGGKFYDMNYDEVQVFGIGGIISYDELGHMFSDVCLAGGCG